MSDGETSPAFASPPCFMHEINPAYMSLEHAADARTWADVDRFRKSERERLIRERLAISPEERMSRASQIAKLILREVGTITGRIVSAYWPFRGKPDLRPLLLEINALGGRTALPVVVEKQRPLEFRPWQEGEKLEKGVWNIPVPSTWERCDPDVIIAPVVGYDRQCFRLGYGGGYFDRTLEQLRHNPLVIGVGYAGSLIRSIYPQPHDIPMDMIVTEGEVRRPAPHRVNIQEPGP